ncbi:MAG TPA: Fe-S cluster assembly protein SufB [Thermoleophilaceae bacterium]|nr:Fe-S cluster assembly protein SufB [Thermoleophilaceae bacterium]
MATVESNPRIAKPSAIEEDDQGQLVARKGISREVVDELSRVKGEPDWMREKRLKSLEIFERKPIPTWGVDLSGLDFDELVLYSPPTAGRYDSWDEVPEEMKKTYEDLGIPQAEREHLAGVVGVWRQEPVYEGLKEEYRKLGIIFCSMDTAITEYPELVEPYFMTKCVPPQDNKFSALHGAVWSGGSFLYVPKGVKVDLPLQAYFRMEGAGEGTFEHTLIIADEGSEVNYIEGCTAQTYSVNSMHSAVVEIFVKEGAKARYTTVQNWSKDVYNLNTKRAMVDAHGTVEWVGGSMGAKYVMLYPGSFLMGEGARADHLNVGVASGDVWKDTGAKVMHLAPNTTSNILAKSISKDGGIMGYRGLVRMGQNSQGSKAHVQCDGLMMDPESRSDTWPDIQIQNPHVTVAHEAVVGKISDEQLFYLQSRGLTEEEAASMIVNGFIEPVTKELPMEYAVELNRLIQLEMEGSIG